MSNAARARNGNSKPKPTVDVFSDPFGDEADAVQKPSSTKPHKVARPTSKSAKASHKAIEDKVNPFADEEPLERLVQQPADRGSRRSDDENQVP